MKRLITVLFLFAFALAPYAQQKRTSKQPARKTATAKKTAVKSQKKANVAKPATTSVQALEKQRQQIQQQIKEQERRLRSNELDVKKRLQNLMVLNSEIEGKRRTIDTIKHDITSLDIEIEMLLGQLDLLQAKLEKNKKNCRIIYKNYEYVLTEYLDDIDNSYNANDLILIKLRIINDLTDMSYMFSGCISLVSFPDLFEKTDNVSESNIKKHLKTNLLSCLNTTRVLNMQNLFAGCISLSHLPDVLNWDTSKVTDMSYMFCRCESLLSLPNLSNWKTNNVKNLEGIFSDCDKLLSLPDLSNWNTEKLSLMGGIM